MVTTVFHMCPHYADTQSVHFFMAACRPMVDWAIDNFAAIMKDRVRTSLDDDLAILIHSMPSKSLVFLLPAGVPQPIQFYSRQD